MESKCGYDKLVILEASSACDRAVDFFDPASGNLHNLIVGLTIAVRFHVFTDVAGARELAHAFATTLTVFFIFCKKYDWATSKLDWMIGEIKNCEI